MRKLLLLILSFGVAVAAVNGVSASTDCQRWIADYKQALSQQASAQKLLAAKRRARAYAHRKLAEFRGETHGPAPHPTRLASTHPHLTPAQMVKRFEVLCGDLPVEPKVLDARMQPDEFISESSLGGPVSGVVLPDDEMIAEEQPPTYDGPNVDGLVPSSVYSENPLYGPVYGGGGYGPYVPPRPPANVIPVTPVQPVAPIPEPSTLILLATGSLGALSVVRRRLA